MGWIQLLQSPLSRRDEIPLMAMGVREGSPEGIKSATVDVNIRENNLKSHRFEGWRKTLFLGSISSIIVLVLNLGFVIWAVQHRALNDGRGALYEGHCKKAKNMSTAFHLAINILATVLLSASNYGMQCLAAPTRNDIDRAHEQGHWLDIGVPSVRNLSKIPVKKAVLWTCLVLSSLPLHLVYNSTIFLTTVAYEYTVYVGRHPFTSYDEKTVTFPIVNGNSSTFEELRTRQENGQFKNLTNSECISAYASNFQSKYSNVLVITDDASGPDFGLVASVGLNSELTDPYDWICSGIDTTEGCSSTLSNIRSQPGQWKVSSNNSPNPVKYCLGEEVPERCKVEFSLPLAIVVIVFNVVKAVILCVVASSIKQNPILTTGDAIASFMRVPDTFTRDGFPLSEQTAKANIQSPWTYNKYRKSWGTAVSFSRITICFASYVVSISLCIGLIMYATSSVYNSSVAWSSGLGAANPQLMIRGSFPSSLAANVLIANTPQAIFSIIYFLTNSVFTCMTLAAEWSTYATHRKGLRVSTTPQSSQRSSYFLSLPYRYAIPIITFSAVLHWLISQSLFLISVEAYAPNLRRFMSSDIMTCGYSPIGVAAALSVSGAMVVCLIGIMGFKRLKSGMPVAGSCSLAISMACHPCITAQGEGEQPGAEYMPLQWGVLPMVDGMGDRCSFSCEEVYPPEDGHIYE